MSIITALIDSFVKLSKPVGSINKQIKIFLEIDDHLKEVEPLLRAALAKEGLLAQSKDDSTAQISATVKYETDDNKPWQIALLIEGDFSCKHALTISCKENRNDGHARISLIRSSIIKPTIRDIKNQLQRS